MRPMAAASACVAIAVASFAIGRATAPRAIVERTAPVVSVVSERSAPSRPDDALRECESRLALAEGVLRAQEHEKVGDPVPFPEDLPPQYRPDRFEDAVLLALEECDSTGLELGHVECSEFPCIAFFRPGPTSYGQQIEALRNCDGWTRTFESWSGGSNGVFMTDEGALEYSYTAPTPGGVDLDGENAFKRLGLRGTAGAEHLMAAVGGRELTALEHLDLSITMSREAGADEMVRVLEQQRALLLEQQASADQ